MGKIFWGLKTFLGENFFGVKNCGRKIFWVKFFSGENFFDPCPLKEGGGVRGVRLVTG